jgi:hypothetical protein
MKTVLMMISMLLISSACYGAEEADCSAGCPDGQKMISFADGDNPSCACVEDGAQMDDTIVDESTQSPGDSDI